ncbi:MAG: DsbE family thiol:disulfide interchange protein [Alphaproteobacteria bacterium]|nr:DsbE family thiol:disulfide interchange protein [Alphaproteobacteria bacterium]MBV9063035.1 DsbE family thiol:disulfide interchange protein [Alphaproteobacteria bacterium]
MKRWLYLIPILVFGGLVYLLFHGLYAPPPDQIPSALLGKPAPHIALPPLDQQARAFDNRDLAAGHVSIINVWASWCVPCRLEAPMLDRLRLQSGSPLYGLVYKDKAARARRFLSEVGNPFSRIDIDSRGRSAIDWGVYDVPETFVIDRKGIVRLRYSGPITEDVLSEVLLPAIHDANRP